MVALARYVKEHTGIAIEQSQGNHDLDCLDAALARLARAAHGPDRQPTPTQALYDAVVGIEWQRGCGFDQDANIPSRLGPRQLDTIVGATRDMIAHSQKTARTTRAAEREKVLLAIGAEAAKYRDMLVGANGRIGVGKSRRMGNRHSLIRGQNGAIFEMINSMTDAEITRFRRKTRLPIQDVVKPDACEHKNGEHVWKITLGEGAFGRARIARNIRDDSYVAVKKCHPRFLVQAGHVGSAASFAPLTQRVSARARVALKAIGASVISPIDERVCSSTKSLRHEYHAQQLNQLSQMPEAMTTKAIREFVKDPQVNSLLNENRHDLLSAIAKACNAPARILTGKDTLYSFSELGMASVFSIVETLGFTRRWLEIAPTSAHLPEQMIRGLASFAEENDRTDPLCSTPQQLALLRRQQAFKIFDSKLFVIKDPEQSRRYRNTLAKKMVEGVAAMHRQNLAHMDVKVNNIVLHQDEQGNVRVKLIDIDNLEQSLTLPGGPTVASKLYAPPEVDCDYGTYDCEKADSYSTGICMRLIAGTSYDDIETLQDAQQKRFQLGPAIARARQAEGPGASVVMPASSAVSGTSLRSISDLLLQPNTCDRWTANDLLRHRFFLDRSEFLADEDFSKFSNLLVRFRIAIE